MFSGISLRRTRLLLVSCVATLALSSCSGGVEVEPPSGKEARDAGFSYGETMKKAVGGQASPEQMAELCGQAIIDGKIVDPKTGRPGDETDLEVDDFVAGCKEAVGAPE